MKHLSFLILVLVIFGALAGTLYNLSYTKSGVAKVLADTHYPIKTVR